jgi:hypothetical protein
MISLFVSYIVKNILQFSVKLQLSIMVTNIDFGGLAKCWFYEFHAQNFLGMLQLACAIVLLRYF